MYTDRYLRPVLCVHSYCFLPLDASTSHLPASRCGVDAAPLTSVPTRLHPCPLSMRRCRTNPPSCFPHDTTQILIRTWAGGCHLFTLCGTCATIGHEHKITVLTAHVESGECAILVDGAFSCTGACCVKGLQCSHVWSSGVMSDTTSRLLLQLWYLRHTPLAGMCVRSTAHGACVCSV
jgi:hypothetical protein